MCVSIYDFWHISFGRGVGHAVLPEGADAFYLAGDTGFDDFVFADSGKRADFVPAARFFPGY